MRPEYHPAVDALLRFFEYQHLPEDLQEVGKPFAGLAHHMAEKLDGGQQNGGAELTTGLRKLLEAKDCMVRAAHASA